MCVEGGTRKGRRRLTCVIIIHTKSWVEKKADHEERRI
jgi:hypothetical protein